MLFGKGFKKMTLGEKIYILRNKMCLSQEEFAEALDVSRQSVSKWEMGQALPQISKIPEICSFLGISADELINDEIIITSTSTDVPLPLPKPQNNNKYFGTDGFRGEVNTVLSPMHAFKVGRFLGWYYADKLSGCRMQNHIPKIVIGKDTRRSSYMLEYAIAAGITASGADAYMLHVTTTPSVSFITKQDGFDCGIMISASHNPYYDNGIKVLNKFGEKLDDRTTSLIEAYIDSDFAPLGIDSDDLPLAKRNRIGEIVDYVAGRNRYVGYLISIARHSYKKLRIGLDCANGASWNIARNVFEALGAQTYVIGNTPNGYNINDGVGSTKIEALQKLVKEHKLDAGFAFDGDADRCIAVDERGKVVTGDHIMYIFAKRLKEMGILNDDTVVATVMSNTGLINALEKENIKCVQTAVGDRFVYECMQHNDYTLGGEASGHIILRKYATTGDGLLTAIILTEEMMERKAALSNLAEPVVLYPQYLRNIRVSDNSAVVRDKDVLSAVETVKEKIGSCGRVLLRKSGTEPLVRIMIEYKDENKLSEFADIIADVIKEKGYES